MFFFSQNEFTVRSALPQDVPVLCRWWNDGNVMEHAGFPRGIGTTKESVARELSPKSSTHRLIIEVENTPIGEMCYRETEKNTAQIGIKICNPSFQNQGLGTKVLTSLCRSLFELYRFDKITLDTMLENKRAQHVYEKIGFVQTAIRPDCWKDQNGVLRTAVDYILLPQNLKAENNTLIIRSALPDDIKQIEPLYALLFERMAELQPQFNCSANQETAFIQSVIEHEEQEILLAQQGKQILGIAVLMITHTPPYPCFVPHRYADLLDLLVIPSARGNGIGSKLLDAAKHWAKLHNADYIELSALSNNHGAVRLYAREGFTECTKIFRAML